jgi:hypothetical protein
LGTRRRSVYKNPSQESDGLGCFSLCFISASSRPLAEEDVWRHHQHQESIDRCTKRRPRRRVVEWKQASFSKFSETDKQSNGCGVCSSRSAPFGHFPVQSSPFNHRENSFARCQADMPLRWSLQFLAAVLDKRLIQQYPCSREAHEIVWCAKSQNILQFGNQPVERGTLWYKSPATNPASSGGAVDITSSSPQTKI